MFVHYGLGAGFDQQIIEQLRNEWDSALQQARPVGQFDSQVPLDTWVDYLFEYMSAYPLGAIYRGIPWVTTKKMLLRIVNSDPAIEWICTKEKSAQRKADDQKVEYLELNNEVELELRDLINAAWSCRIERLGKEYTAEESDKINAAALKLWKCIKDKRNAENTPAGGRASIRPDTKSRTKK